MITELKNHKYVNINSGTARVTVLAEDVSKHKVNLFSALISTPDGGFSLPLDTILGRTREINDVFNSHGEFGGSTVGNEILNEKNVDMRFGDDFVTLTENPIGLEINKNTIVNMLQGESFTTELDGKVVVQSIVGTNGTVKRGKRATSGHEFGKLFEEMGKLKVPQGKDENGNPILQENTRITAYNRTGVCVMLEFFTEFDASRKQGLAFVYALAGDTQWEEDSDYNKLSANVQLLCDVRYTNGYMLEGFGVEHLPKDSQSRINVLVVEEVSDDVPSQDGISISAEGVITFGANVDKSKVKAGTIIFAKSTDIPEIEGGSSYFVAVKSVNGQVCVAASTVISADGRNTVKPASVDGYVFVGHDFDFETGRFIQA